MNPSAKSDEGQYVSVVNNSGAWPICRVCSARVMAQVAADRASPVPGSVQDKSERDVEGDSGYSEGTDDYGTETSLR